MSNEEISVPCMYCQNNLRVFVADVERIVKCHACGRFNKIQAKVQKRMELECSVCQAAWNIPLKTRGKIYKCWNCDVEAQIPGPTELVIEEVFFEQQVEQGVEGYEIIVSLSNIGTPANIMGMQLAFENSGDVGHFFSAQEDINNTGELYSGASMQLKTTVNIAEEAPPGITNIYINIVGQDILEEREVSINTVVQVYIIQQKVFAIQTEHEFNEISGQAFAIQLWACLPDGEVDETYNGIHTIEFQTNATETAWGALPVIPKDLTLEFQEGIAVTGREFCFFNALETPEIVAIENIIGGPRGASDNINVLPSDIYGFEVTLQSPQTDSCPFQGTNTIKAIDRYGNIIVAFQEDVWIQGTRNAGSLSIEGYPPNIIPKEVFQNGVVDLTALGVRYSSDRDIEGTISESFIVSYQDKEGTSEDVQIHENPIKVSVADINSPEIVEQGKIFNTTITLANTTQYDLEIQSENIKLDFSHDTKIVNDFYNTKLYYNEQPIDSNIYLPTGGQVSLSLDLEVADGAPVGITWLEFYMGIEEVTQGIMGKVKGSFQWNVEPEGRTFRVAQDNSIMKAGEAFALEITTYLGENVDDRYDGAKVLHFEHDATASVNGIEPDIPRKITVHFREGVGVTDEVFVFTNSSEAPSIIISDFEAGGAKSEPIRFSVFASELDFFWVSFQNELINGESFQNENQIMAMDAYGNLILDFERDCQIQTIENNGDIYIGDEKSNIISADSFRDGIVELGELQVSYHSNMRTKLPMEEKFYISCGDKQGESHTITILPRTAEIVIVRCSAPEEIDYGNEEYPIYLELENTGDHPANISSVLFSFENNGDVSSHYTILPSPANSNLLIPGAPLQLTYITKIGPKAPIGTTKIAVKVSGVDNDSSIPIQAKTEFQWKIEIQDRSFKLQTANKNQEKAGKPFAVKLVAYIENARKDTSFSGEKTIEFTSNATPSKNSSLSEIPSRVTVQFDKGEAITDTIFTFVNSEERPFIQAKDTTGKIHGQTSLVEIIPGELESFEVLTTSEFKNGGNIGDNNTVTALDGFGNIKKDFNEHVRYEFENISGWFEKDGVKLEHIQKEWFKNGIAKLGSYSLSIHCSASNKLPTTTALKVSSQNVVSQSENFTLLPIPIQIDGKLSLKEKVIQGSSFPISLSLHNQGEIAGQIKNISFVALRGNKEYEIKDVEAYDAYSEIIPGRTELQYEIRLPNMVPIGKILVKVFATVIDAAGSTQVDIEEEQYIQVEPSGRAFQVTTENNQHEKAGIPFALRITAMLEDSQDDSYAGEYTLVFDTDATSSPNGQKSSIPEILNVMFHKGQAVTSREFVLYNSFEEAEIKVKEKVEGGAEGLTEGIVLAPGNLDSFQFHLEKTQVNTKHFVGENTLTVIDAYGNTKADFNDDVKIQSEKRGDIFLEAIEAKNVIPGSAFEDGVANLTLLGISFTSIGGYLPLNTIFTASYGEKEGSSSEISIDPRESALEILEVTIDEDIFQGDKNRSISFKMKNIGDTLINIDEVLFELALEDENITEQFFITSLPQNPNSVSPDSASSFFYHVDIDNDASVGEVSLFIMVKGSEASNPDVIVEITEDEHFSINEKLREFKIMTQHNNKEKAGENFSITLTAYRDGEVDGKYKGEREILFQTNAKPTDGNIISCPESEIITFVDGKGETQESFNFTNSAERPVIEAKELKRAYGTSDEIILQCGDIKSLKILFDKRDSDYLLQPLDEYNNIIPRDIKLDEDIRAGSILSGSGGMFYEIDEIIGHGAMGKVYKGKRLNDGIDVAIKTMLFSALSDISRFILEGLMLIRFNHPNIVKGYDLRQICTIEGGRAQSKLFMVMELLPGKTVKDLLDNSKTGVITTAYATKIILHSARALAYMWENQTIHRDIKPENIQITHNDEVKLIDLGIARAEGAEVDIYLTQKDTIVGSYPYISPERLKSTKVDFKADIYSLGATYYHVLTGMPPYLDTYKGGGGRDLLDYLIRVRTKRMPTPPHKLVDIPANVSNVIMTMLHIKASKRHSSAEEMLEELEKLYNEVK